MNPPDSTKIDSTDGEIDHQESQAFAYDRVAYAGSASEFMNLRNLEVMGALFGLPTVSPTRCRVLELGCADGTNLLPHAAEFPESKFVGVDLAAEAIDRAKAIAQQAGVENAVFHHANVSDLDASLGKFDYILCPGLFSWVTDDERLEVLRVCHDHLDTGGIAVVSYNTYPGWHLGRGLQDFMNRYARSHQAPSQQVAVARSAADFIAKNTASNTPHGMYYSRARARLAARGDAYVYHEYLTDRNRPFYFEEFAKMAGDQGLRFVTEADFQHASGFGLDASGRAVLAKVPREDREQVLDYLLNTSHRQSVLCRADHSLTPSTPADPIEQFSVAMIDRFEGTQVTWDDDQPARFSLVQGAATVTDRFVKAALAHLMKQSPQAVTMKATFEAAKSMTGSPPDSPADFGRTMMTLYAAGLIRVFKTVPPLADTISDHPCATALVRTVAAGSTVVVNQWHQDVLDLSDDQRWLLTLLDGTQTVGQLAQQWEARAGQREAVDGELGDFVGESLQRFLHGRLLVA